MKHVHGYVHVYFSKSAHFYSMQEANVKTAASKKKKKV